jgi:hypothetical protein
VFEFAQSPFDVPDDFADVCRRTWHQIAATGTWWNGPDRVAIAETARSARAGTAVAGTDLPEAAVEVALMIGGTPAHTTREWAESMIDTLGEERYIEAASLASRVVPIDTFTRLMGSPLQPLPEAGDGEPSRRMADPPPKRSRAWVRMVGFPTPPDVFTAVPAEAAAMNDISNTFYMPEFDMQYPDYTRMGLHRTQIETVASTTSHGNECFF